ncbi:mitochondrial large subunit ribosomal protein-domain-containing protein [Phyllosticta citrichinensis]|uniref:Large ribosomal subunit protein mL49 n=1 Tax=Phyllosticta citrichinensis TaxID=1130410 RepID=A0ABR1XRZ7_9PEZI
MFRLPALFRAAATPKPAAPASIARLSQCARLRSEAPAPASTPAPAPEFKSTTVAPTSRPNLPYFVLRTGSAKLPVYSETKGGGTLRQTKLRKISGDVRALKKALQSELGLDPSEVKINDLTQQILVKGDRKMEIQTWLIAKGF